MDELAWRRRAYRFFVHCICDALFCFLRCQAKAERRNKEHKVISIKNGKKKTSEVAKLKQGAKP